MNIVRVTKHFRRVVSDGDYGSIASGTEITVEEQVSTSEELQELNKKLAKAARVLTHKDLEEYIALKKEKKAI